MRFERWRAGARCGLTDQEVAEALALIRAHGGVARAALTRPFGPDGSITHQQFDFEHDAWRFAVDVRAVFRRGELKFHTFDTDQAIFGCQAIEELSVAMMARFGLAGMFASQDGKMLVHSAELAAQLPKIMQDVLVVTSRQAFAEAMRAHHAR